jgi:hypothetical protein
LRDAKKELRDATIQPPPVAESAHAPRWEPAEIIAECESVSRSFTLNVHGE